MSEEQTTVDETTAVADETLKKIREPKKNSIPSDEIAVMTAGIAQYTKTSFLVVGYKDGVRIALPKTSGVSRAYFYANNDYSLIPEHEAITVFSAEQRKEQRLGGIMAEIDFSKGLDLAKEALAALVQIVRDAPVPVAKPKREPKIKAVAPAVASTESALVDDVDTADEQDESSTLEA